MTNVHTVTARSPPCVQEERFPSLMAVQNVIQVSMTENNSSPHEPMRPMPSHFFESRQIFLQNLFGPELVNQSQVVNCFGDSICPNFSLDVPWVNTLLSVCHCWRICYQGGSSRGFWVGLCHCWGYWVSWRGSVFFWMWDGFLPGFERQICQR